tara:strand:+ start:1624 stop:2373 length:750 start_codon:yes stop_codon:yes gene_type:complete
MAAGKFGPASVIFLVDGFNLISQKLKGLREKHTSPVEDVTGLGDSSQVNDPVGVLTTEVTQDGAYFDTTATTGGHVAFAGNIPTSAQATQRVMCLGMAGNTTGYAFTGFQGTYSNEYEVLAESGSLTKANVTFAMTGSRDAGKIIQPLASKTADWNTNSTSVDNAASTSNGGVGFLQCTASTGFTNFTGKIMESSDDSTFTALVTFSSSVSAPFAERLEMSGTVNRYLSFNGDVSGSGSITVFAGFSRS